MPSIKNLNNGKYRVFITDGTDAKGKVRRTSKVISARSEKVASKMAYELEQKFKQGEIPVGKDYTFKELVDKWKSLAVDGLAITTLERYDVILNRGMLNFFGNRKINSVKTIDIEEFLQTLRCDGVRQDGKKGGYSPKTIRHAYVLLNRLFSLALKWDMISQNPCRKVTKPRVDAKAESYYSIEQIKMLLERLYKEKEDLENHIEHSVKYDKYYSKEQIERSIAIRRFKELMKRVYILVSLTAGCRRSEACGLEYSDVDFESNIISFKRTSHYSVKQGIYSKDTLKNGSPMRSLVMPVEVLGLIKELKEAHDKCQEIMGDEWEQSDRLFIAVKTERVSHAGGPIMPDNVSQWFDRFLEKNSMPHLKLHGLRHTAASFLLNQGIDVQTVADRLGHRDTRVTQNIYNHVYEKNKKASADAFSTLFK